MFCDEKINQFPSIRFKEFTNAWEQWKLPKILNNIKNRVHSIVTIMNLVIDV